MKRPDKNRAQNEVEDLFAQARATPPQMPEGLMARVMADADSLQPGVRETVWQVLWRAVGGAPGLGGLVTATFVGFWLGVSPPDNMPDLAGQVLGQQDSTTLETTAADLTGFGWDIDEG